MSSLANISNPTPTLPVAVSAEESFTVRGVGLNDILHIYYRHTGALSLAFEKLASQYRSQGGVDADDVSGLIAGAIQEFPLLIAELITIATGADPDDVAAFGRWTDVVQRMSVGVQLSAMEKIGALTFTSEMPPKKLFALVARSIGLAQATAGEKTQIPAAG